MRPGVAEPTAADESCAKTSAIALGTSVPRVADDSAAAGEVSDLLLVSLTTGDSTLDVSTGPELSGSDDSTHEDDAEIAIGSAPSSGKECGEDSTSGSTSPSLDSDDGETDSFWRSGNSELTGTDSSENCSVSFGGKDGEDGMSGASSPSAGTERGGFGSSSGLEILRSGLELRDEVG
jgi:hypothetical protein